MKTRQTTWAFAHLEVNASKTVWEIGEAYRKKFKEIKINHGNRHPMQLLKYWYFLYLTGSRPQEPILEPMPIISFARKGNETWVEIQKVNEKHFSKTVALDPNQKVEYMKRRRLDLDKSERQVIEQAFPVFNEWEQKMWVILTDGGMLTRGDEIFKFHEWKSTTPNNINSMIKTNFRTDLRDNNNRLHQNVGVTPYILRHMRIWNLIVNHGADPVWVVKVFGWKDQKMLYHYADIRQRLNIGSQLDILRRTNMLTNLSVDVAKAMPNY